MGKNDSFWILNKKMKRYIIQLVIGPNYETIC